MFQKFIPVPTLRDRVPDEAPPAILPNGVVLGPLRERYTAQGTMYFRECGVPVCSDHAMRVVWRSNKLDFIRRGYNMRFHDEKRYLFQWLHKTSVGWQLTKEGQELLDAILSPSELPIIFESETLELDPLPGGLEKFLRGYQQQPSRQLYRALANGAREWGYSGAADLSDMGVGKTYMDLAASLATGRKIGVLCPSAGAQGWERAFAHFGATPYFIGTYEAVRGAFRPHIATLDADGRFFWKNAGEIVLILDEAQALRHDDTLTVACCSAAIRQGIPIIVASATIATSPIEMKFAGRVTGLHMGKDDWQRFLVRHGCSKKTANGAFVWDQEPHHLARINASLFPRRGCRVRKQELGEECPETIIEVLMLEIAEAAEIERSWIQARELIDLLEKQHESAAKIRMMKTKTYQRIWMRIEEVLVPHVAKLAREEVRAGNSVAIFMNFNASRLAMSGLLGTNAGFYGGQNIKRRQYFEREFQEDREHILISNIGAGGASVSLHDVRGERPRVSYIFPTDHVVKMVQATGRIDRVGGKSVSRQFIPCVAGSITSKMVERTRRKMLNIDTINDGSSLSGARF